MIEVPVLDNSGEQTASVHIDEAKLGGKVRLKLLKQAVLMYEANRRQGTASTKSRGEVRGSTRKLYRQKGTGHARMGSNRSPVRVGGGVAFGPKPRDYTWQMPRKQRQLATRSALLAKVRDGEVRAVESIPADEIKTKPLAAFVRSLGLEGSVLLVSAEYNRNLVLSGKNLPDVGVSNAHDLNAWELLRYKWIVMETQALRTLAGAES
jgi:large subunit ribosomal protein L4